MERKQEQESFGEEEAAAMAASSTLWSLLHRVASGCAGYLGLTRLCDDDESLKAPTATARQEEVAVLQEEVVTVIEVQSRSLNFKKNRDIKQGPGGRGGRNH